MAKKKTAAASKKVTASTKKKTVAKKASKVTPAAKKTAAPKVAKKPSAKKAPAKKATVKKATAPKKSPVKKAVAKKATAKKTVVKKTPAKKTAVKKVAAKKPSAKKTVVKKVAAKKAPVKKAAVKKAAEAPVTTEKKAKLPKMRAADIRKFRQILLHHRDSIVDGISFHSADNLNRSQRDVTGDISGYSLHMADQGTDNYDREYALNQISTGQGRLYEIDAALQRCDEGTYGVCEMTGELIEVERLEIIPWTRYSVAAQKEIEKGRTRYRPFGPTLSQGS